MMQRIPLSQRPQEVARLEGMARSNANPLVQAIATVIDPIARAIDQHSDFRYVERRQGQYPRQYKVWFRGVSHMFRYNHLVHAVEIKRQGQQGQVVRTITAGASARQINAWIAAL